jgi:small conductance mechanosensitive channel
MINEHLVTLSKIDSILTLYVFPFAWKVLGAIAAWVIGTFFISMAQKLLRAAMNRRRIDPTLTNYAYSTSGVALRILLVVSILGIFGLETTSFSALLAAAGVAIGMAWSGLLSNFAAGIFLILFRPFRVGDVITAASATGTVREIGLFSITLDSGDNLRYFIGNNKIFSDNILNYTLNRYRLLNFKVQISMAVDPFDALAKLQASLAQVPGVLKEPAPAGAIAEFNPLGILLNLSVACHHLDSANVTTAGNRAIYETLKAAHYPAPENKMVIINQTPVVATTNAALNPG